MGDTFREDGSNPIRRYALPWKQTSLEAEQVRFIQRWQAGGVSFVDLCRQFGISRKTGYKRVDRFRWNGWEGLRDLTRSPHRRPNATPHAVAERLIAARRQRPTWGPKKLVARLRSVEPAVRWPAPSTAEDILDRAGLVRHRNRRRHAAPWNEPFAAADHPNDVWSIDFKGWFRTQDGVRIDPLTVQDAASRYLLVCNGLQKPNGPLARRVLERAFREYGLPWAIRTDNGPPFASVGLGSLSPLAVWWVKLGIVPERIEPGHPEQNGRLERLHRTLKAETASPPRSTSAVSKEPLTPFVTPTTLSGHTRPWDSRLLHVATMNRTGPTQARYRRRSMSRGSRCGRYALMARSSGKVAPSTSAKPSEVNL